MACIIEILSTPAKRTNSRGSVLNSCSLARAHASTKLTASARFSSPSCKETDRIHTELDRLMFQGVYIIEQLPATCFKTDIRRPFIKSCHSMFSILEVSKSESRSHNYTR